MSFYLRTSVNVGPFRFNFSKSGIGVSTGIKGLRVGTGPRGNYISVSSGVLRYRATLPPTVSNARTTPISQPLDQKSPSSVGAMIPITSADVSAMQDSTSSELLKELNEKNRRPDYWKWFAIGSIVVLGMILIIASMTAFVISSIFLAGVTLYIGVRDAVAKSVVLCYDLDEPNEQAFQALHNGFAKISTCHKIWRIDSKGKVHDKKYHAGADSLVVRKEISFSRGLPPRVKSNIEVPLIVAAEMSMYLMPECILIYTSDGIGAIAYKDMQIHSSQRRFIEGSPMPSDAQVVDRTWKYVNKKGGPDKRFKDNQELPIALYEEIHLRSSSGLNELFQISRHSISDSFKEAVGKMATALPA